MKRPMAFAENLRHYRKKFGWTQHELAEKIGYTEKSVSKWENGNGLPTVELLLSLAELFEISTDELIFEKNNRTYLLGIDGGGTKTVFQLSDDEGTVLKTLTKGATNPNDIGMDNAIAILREGIHEICGGLPYASITLFAGLSGGGMTGDNAKILHRFFAEFGFLAFDNGSDVENLIGLCGENPCVLVIMGTGFLVYGLNGETRRRVAGWGQFFDDGGSGYTIGRDGIAAALSAIDGSGTETLLTELLETALGESAEAHLAAFYRGGKRYIAEFAATVFCAAALGDGVAQSIVEKNTAYAAEKIRTALKSLVDPTAPKEIPVLFSGGISDAYPALLTQIQEHLHDVSCRLIQQTQPPVAGALRRAKQILEEKRISEKGAEPC